MQEKRLWNGVQIPEIGYGTWQTKDGNEAQECVKQAILAGYRHIDSASIYNNEIGVGRGILTSRKNRKELFITSKVWNSERGYDKTIQAFECTLKNLGLDYLDLYLIHWPCNEKQSKDYEGINLDTYRALIDLYKSGKVRAIGVSNFLPHHLEPLVKTEVPPMINQIEFHPGYIQKDVIDYCKQHKIVVEGWSPLGCGRVLQEDLIVDLANKYQKSPTQICIRYAIENDVIPLPKSTKPQRMIANRQIFDFSLSKEDIEKINDMPITGWSGNHPDQVKR